MRVLFLLFAILPILEITLLVQVGGLIGGWNTIAIVIITAFVGAYLVRREGFHTMQTAQEKMQRNEVPGKEVVEGLMLVVSGVLLVTPGFITDIFGFLLVIPVTRHLIAGHVARHMKMRVVTTGGFGGQAGGTQSPFNHSGNDAGDVFEGEYTDKSKNDENQRLR